MGESEMLPVKFQVDVVALRVLLCLGVGPDAVHGLVTAFVADAMKGIAGAGSFSHVGKPGLKVSPSFTDIDSALAVFPVTRIVRVGGP